MARKAVGLQGILDAETREQQVWRVSVHVGYVRIFYFGKLHRAFCGNHQEVCECDGEETTRRNDGKKLEIRRTECQDPNNQSFPRVVNCACCIVSLRNV